MGKKLKMVRTNLTKDNAEEIELLLEANDISAVLEEKGGSCSVFVQEHDLDEAHIIIQSQEAFDDFYDFDLDGLEEDDLLDDEI